MASPAADFRSDTVTRPTPGMLEAMMKAPLGDDVWGDDPTINALQRKVAEMFEHEDALFFPSGVMANQTAIKVHTQPGDEAICSTTAHVLLYEGGGMAFNSGVQPKTLPGDSGGRLTAAQISSAICQAEDAHFPNTTLVCLENTTNKGGGACYSMTDMEEISKLCRGKGVRLHLDGARLFNAMVASRQSDPPVVTDRRSYGPRDVGPLFDSISICLSKGLGCPVGSLLLGSKLFIARAKRIRKILGGAMRQAGILAGAGLYALEHHVERLAEDHARAQVLGDALKALPASCVESVAPVSTNIVIWTLAKPHDPQAVVELFKQQGVLICPMGGQVLRFVTHLDLSQQDMDRALDVIKRLATLLM